MTVHSSEIKQYIRDHQYLFWWIREAEKENISLNLLIETILNFGNISDIKKLFELVGIDKVASIFHEQITRRRVNYSPRTIYFFRRYFKKHAHGTSDKITV